METTPIIKNILLPKLKKDSKYSDEKIGPSFWRNFSTVLVRFEENAQPLYTAIYGLELGNPELIIDKLPKIYAQFIKELAECYVLGQTSEATDYLVKTNNKTFLKEFQFFKTMQQAIKSVERKCIKTELPQSYDRLTFELSETEIDNAIKKKAREELKKKMKLWDAELEEEGDVVPVFSVVAPENKITLDKTHSKVISLSWMKYAVAASIIIAMGILYFKNTDPTIIPVENSVVTTEDKKETVEPQKNTPINEEVVLAEMETSSRSITVFEPSSFGFTSTDKKPKVTVHFKNPTQRILSLEKLLEKNKVGITIDSKILDKYKAELADLNKVKEKYVFNGKKLTLFCKCDPKQFIILSTEDKQYFLKKGSVFYNLKISSVSLDLQKVNDATTIEALEKIAFENE